MNWCGLWSVFSQESHLKDLENCVKHILPWSTAVVICLGFNLSEGKGLGPYIQSGQIQGRQQLTSPTLAEPGYFCGKSETYVRTSQRGRRREEGSDRSLVWASPSNNFSCMHCRVSMGWCGCIQLSIWDKGREGYPPFPQVLFTIFPRFNNSFIRERNKKLMVKRSKQKQTK